MYFPLAVFIGIRYLRSQRSNFISFISLTSLLGITLGVAVLITVLSVMNGFNYEIRTRIFGMANEITLTGVNQALLNWPNIRKKVLLHPEVEAAAPFVRGQGILISSRQQPQPVLIMGIDLALEKTVSQLAGKIVAGKLTSLKARQFGIVIGEQLAEHLGVNLGDKINLLTPTVSTTPLVLVPRFKAFTVVGIFRVGRGFGFDSNLAYISLHDAQSLFRLSQTVSGLRLKVQDLYHAPGVASDLSQQFDYHYQLNDWTQEYGSLMHAISLEKKMMFLILLLLIAISTFNLVSSLMMVVTEKRSDIAILRTLGATPKTILSIFIIQGCVIGVLGTLFGLISGLSLAYYAPDLLQWVEKIFSIELLSSNVYFFVDKLPSRIELVDIYQICGAALIMSFIATLYPAWQAAKTLPAQALRYE